MNKCYRLLQLTNYDLGPVAVGAYIPVGTMTREVRAGSQCNDTFIVTTSNNNSIYINEQGFYKIAYTGYLEVAVAGDIVVELQISGVTLRTATVTAPAAGTYLVSFDFVTRALKDCCNNVNTQLLVRLLNSGIAITDGEANLVIERVYA